ncbi:hypothetical protein AA0113_g5224 [Alternaria arborescens]|uniref:LysM domain-containing protein n=1 Tax=Alternaria arborescens TaxID=156630 RepID=A0A4Q4S5A4_9PLEO|nr:hypothetical protein AA0113_g5224 [Alternaria arborescens]
MGRWTDVDSDAERLPDGFERIGYDADTQTYTFRDASGRVYESEPGNRYGELRATGERSQPISDEERLEQHEAIEKDNRSAVRMMLPFALLVLVFLFLVFKLVDKSEDTYVSACGKGNRQAYISKGDTCWALAEAHGISVDDFLSLRGNEGVDCDKLRIGWGICLPTTQ